MEEKAHRPKRRFYGRKGARKKQDKYVELKPQTAVPWTFCTVPYMQILLLLVMVLAAPALALHALKVPADIARYVMVSIGIGYALFTLRWVHTVELRDMSLAVRRRYKIMGKERLHVIAYDEMKNFSRKGIGGFEIHLVSGGHFRLYAVSPNASIFRDMLLSRVKRSRNGYFSGLMTEEAVDLNPRIRSGWVPLGKLRFQAQEQEKLSQREKTSRQ